MTLIGTEEGTEERCEYKTQTVTNYARKFLRGHWFFLVLGQKRNGTELTLADPMDLGTKLQNK